MPGFSRWGTVFPSFKFSYALIKRCPQGLEAVPFKNWVFQQPVKPDVCQPHPLRARFFLAARTAHRIEGTLGSFTSGHEFPSIRFDRATRTLSAPAGRVLPRAQVDSFRAAVLRVFGRPDAFLYRVCSFE